MACPRCKSARVQRGFNDSLIVLRIAGLHKLLCANCGLEFQGFDPLGKVQRAVPERKREAGVERRRYPRYKAHLAASIALVRQDARSGKISYSRPSRGHCEAISEAGMALSFVGSRFSEFDLSRKGCRLFVTVELPDGPIAAVVSIANFHRPDSDQGKGKWQMGVKIKHLSEPDTARLTAYLEKRAMGEPYLALD